MGENRPPGTGAAKGAAAAAERLAPAAALELVRETVASVLEARIERLGPRGSGAYEHYSGLLRRGFPIPAYDLAALDIVRRHVPRLPSYHEIGSGIATLPFLLALNGFRACGIERNPRRHASAVAIWQELARKSGVAAADCRLLRGSFPDAVKRLDVSQSIAIVTDLIAPQTAEQRLSILAGLRRYRFVLLDLQRFCVKREERDEQLALLAELRAQGFRPTREFDDDRGHEYTFSLFENDAAARQRRHPAGRWSWLLRPWR